MDALTPEDYARLKAMAIRVYRRNPGATVSATELLHEAWIKLDRSVAEIENDDHYLRVAARAMRQILVDRARARRRDKRGGERVRTTLSHQGEAPMVLDLLTLDELLSQLAQGSERAATVVELKVFGGLSGDEIARSLGVSRGTVVTDWRFARAFLAKRMEGQLGEQAPEE
ncbi:MAG: sigma-70 family RNA polymerase sigma factor [Alphaproteobacteria bacterium]|nr:sigma-70 family RNA polymerase sigma factor [Alphaproteobacteria bacterium]MCB9794336.1 sigma-70 family RNA polymerase sigma factor [Alphaproteobacteria bacterium]